MTNSQCQIFNQIGEYTLLRLLLAQFVQKQHLLMARFANQRNGPVGKQRE
jgi:hypothetical protein